MQLPPGAWDSHVHVIDEDSFPFSANAPYRPGKATLEDLQTFESALGVSKVVLVAVSVYGTDNSSIMSALAQLGGKGRAVVAIDPSKITESEILEMHRAGVRGIRLNLKTFGRTCDKEILEVELLLCADRIRKFGWCIQLYIGLEQVALLHDVLPNLGVQVVIDHMGSPTVEERVQEQVGYAEMIDLLQRGLIWVKLSGVYRFSNVPGLDQYGKTLIRTNPDRVVWASDWPHTGGTAFNISGDDNRVQQFRKVDDAGFVVKCFDWCGQEPQVIRKLFVENPETLWNSPTVGDGLLLQKPNTTRSARLVLQNEARL
ncbi:hypothetical protein LTR05_000577 [Lithohypha guttulata]|uniref:Amidohydrolase-related domain-containing protein n=1 Tax=Lithohypha guttulata TaxID=1690604 RepID=A0AAN7Y9Q2_9EURO|nr:hypothetical protein LTR05_000577 [Lithohypha guttulata]